MVASTWGLEDAAPKKVGGVGLAALVGLLRFCAALCDMLEVVLQVDQSVAARLKDVVEPAEGRSVSVPALRTGAFGYLIDGSEDHLCLDGKELKYSSG